MHAYGPLCTLFYDADKPAADDTEVAWYRQNLPGEGGPLLEVMCGSGRLLVPMVAQGSKVHGVDYSAAMLASCEARLAAAGLTASLFRQDVTQLNLPFRYAGAFIAAGSFQLITDPAAAIAALERVRAHLVEPGVLLLDAFIPSASLRRLAAPLVEVRNVKLADGTQIGLRSETTFWPDANLCRSDNRYVHREGAARLAEEHETLTITWYAQDTLVSLVREAGYRDVLVAPSPRADDDSETYAILARA